jgi:hypothetical protein
MEILADGSIKGQTFSGDKYKGEYPRPKRGETYRQYRERVGKLKEEGFHLGDLSWGDWQSYCMGSGSYEGADADQKIWS